MPKKLTTKEFIKKAESVHGKKYDYSLVNYSGTYCYIEVICKEHGAFKQKPREHLQGYGCKACAKIEKASFSQAEFIRKAKVKHNSKYSYEKLIYIKSHAKITIVCPIHGDFTQEAGAHLQGCGCRKCQYENNAQKNSKDTEWFVGKSRKIHKDKYTYENTKYIKSSKNVVITCPKHGGFLQQPMSHLRGSGCPQCYGNKGRTTDSFIKEANLVHNNLYDYTLVNYINHRTKIDIICDRCKNTFEQIPKFHLKGGGCPYCANMKIFQGNCLAAKWPELAKEWHPIKNEELTPYNVGIGSYKKAWWICKKGHEWEAVIASRTSMNCGCPYCSGNKVCYDNCLATIIPNLAKEWHPIKNGGLTPYDVTSGSQKKVFWQCNKGHSWKTSVSSRKSGYGCPRCSNVISKPEIQFLNYMRVPNKPSNRQYRISRYKVDGFIRKRKNGDINTVYEFLGDYWHGNPEIFKPRQINKSAKKTYGRLYKETFQRLSKIKDMGYNVKYIWESEWKAFKNGEIVTPKIKSI